MPEKAASEDLENKCRIAEIMQYSCKPKKNRLGRYEPVHVTRRCLDRSAVEVTRVLNVDLTTGHVKLPQTLGEQLPKGKPWHDIDKYDTSIEDAT